MGKGKKRSFNDPADQLLKLRYNQAKKQGKEIWDKGFTINSDVFKQIKEIEAYKYEPKPIIKARQSGWSPGRFGEIITQPGGIWTISTDGSYIYAGEQEKKEPEKTPEEIRDDWAEKWVAEQT